MLRKIKTIVEGIGDVSATTSIICKCAAAYGAQVAIADPPIKSGGAVRLSRPGELERHVELAMSYDVDEVIIILDLDDHCAKRFAEEFHARAQPIAQRSGKQLRICFCVREFECWFLANIEDIRPALPDHGIDPSATFPNAHRIRGAKERLSKACSGKKYKPARDQNLFVKQINVQNLARVDRSFRKLLKEATGLTYEELEVKCPQ